jgi:hypothetical protein
MIGFTLLPYRLERGSEPKGSRAKIFSCVGNGVYVLKCAQLQKSYSRVEDYALCVRLMDDEPRSLSPDEKNSLYMKTLIPFTVVLILFSAYFVYRMDTNPFRSMLETLLGWGLPFMVSVMLTMVFTLEFFYHRLVRKSFRFHAKRLGMDTLLVGLLATSFLAVTYGLDSVLSPYVGESNTLLVALLSWSVVLTVLVTKFQRFFRKYWKEP